MLLAADEVARSLAGAWDLSQRRSQGLKRLDASPAGALRSFAAILLLAPAFVVVLAANRAAHGVLVQGAGLFDDVALVLQVALRMTIAFFTLPLLAHALSGLLGLRHRLPGFIVACNWSSVLAGTVMSVPSLLFALGLATEALATLYAVAFLVVVAHLRWFVTKAALGVSTGLAALVVLLDLGAEILLVQLV